MSIKIKHLISKNEKFRVDYNYNVTNVTKITNVSKY